LASDDEWAGENRVNLLDITGNVIGPATQEQIEASNAAAARNGGPGIIRIHPETGAITADGRRVYVEQGPKLRVYDVCLPLLVLAPSVDDVNRFIDRLDSGPAEIVQYEGHDNEVRLAVAVQPELADEVHEVDTDPDIEVGAMPQPVPTEWHVQFIRNQVQHMIYRLGLDFGASDAEVHVTNWITNTTYRALFD
jgi:hypothetical protein